MTEPQPPQSPAYDAAYRPPQLCSLALISFISSLVGILMAIFCLPLALPPAVVGVILGHLGRGAIRRADGTLYGDGFAIAGLIMGYIMVGLIVTGVLIMVLFFGGMAALGSQM